MGGLLLWSLVFVFTAIWVFRSFKKQQLFASPFLLFWLFIWSFCGGFIYVNVVYRNFSCIYWLRTEKYSKIEGLIQNHEIVNERSQTETFSVNGVSFEISSSSPYNCAPHIVSDEEGSIPLNNNDQVEVYYRYYQFAEDEPKNLILLFKVYKQDVLKDQ